jgi:hypothetical protein
VNAIIEIIGKKDVKLPDYSQDLRHINLIIFDAEQRIFDISSEEYFRYLYSESLRMALLKTKFQEIFLITVLDKSQWMYISLKMGLMVAEFFMFRKIVVEYFSERLNGSLNDFMIFFANYMYYRTENTLYRYDEGKIEVIWSNTGLSFGEENINVHDYNDRPIPLDASIPILSTEMLSFFKSDNFQTKLKEVWQNNTFIGKFAFPVKDQVSWEPMPFKRAIVQRKGD